MGWFDNLFVSRKQGWKESILTNYPMHIRDIELNEGLTVINVFYELIGDGWNPLPRDSKEA